MEAAIGSDRASLQNSVAKTAFWEHAAFDWPFDIVLDFLCNHYPSHDAKNWLAKRTKNLHRTKKKTGKICLRLKKNESSQLMVERMLLEACRHGHTQGMSKHFLAMQQQDAEGQWTRMTLNRVAKIGHHTEVLRLLSQNEPNAKKNEVDSR